MSFTNIPLRRVPKAAALGGTAIQQAADQAVSNQIMPSKDIMVGRTPSGTFLTLRNPTAAAEGGASVEVMLITSKADRPVNLTNGTTKDDGTFVYAKLEKGSAAQKVLLPQYLRQFYRTDTTTTIKPDYEVGDAIYCVKLPNIGPNGEEYLDLNVDARQWSIPVTVCQNEVTSKYWIPTTAKA